MSKAEERIYKATERALEAYPVNEVDSLEEMQNEMKRTIFCKGYHQAEKDLELTCDDIKTIDKLLNQCVDCTNPYQEVLKRFKQIKNNQT